MKKRPATIDINLVPKDPFLATTTGKSLLWALTAGRYLLIFTIVVVIISLSTRFALDAQITDLNNKILLNETRIRGYGTLEQDFRSAQTKIQDYQSITSGAAIIESFPQLTAITPFDVQLTSLTMRPESVTIEGTSLSRDSFNTYINNLQLTPYFTSVSIDSLEAEEEAAGYTFSIVAQTNAQPKSAETQAPAPTNSNEDLAL